MANDDLRKKLVKALASIVDFDIETELLHSASSFEDAVSLLFERLIAELKAVNKIFNPQKISADIIDMKSKQDVESQIEAFLNKVYDGVFIKAVQQYIDIAKYHRTPKPSEKIPLLKKQMHNYVKELDMELQNINATASRFLEMFSEYGLANAEDGKKLKFLSQITSREFFEILKKGDVDLILL